MASREQIRQAEMILNAHINRHEQRNAHSDEWRNLPEYPSREEILPKDEATPDGQYEEWNEYQKELLYDKNLPTNIIDGPWPSTKEYIGAHYQILREDAVAPLRNSVKEFFQNPSMADSDITSVYTDVHIEGIKLTRLGLVFRVNFSHQRAGRRIRWEQSKRLQPGNIVALSPQNDNFASICHIAAVADRPIEGGLDQNPPTIDLFWTDITEIPFDPVTAYVMIEARSGFYEASRSMLMALQKLACEKFPLSKHIVHLDTSVDAPEYVQSQPFMDLSSLEARTCEDEDVPDLAEVKNNSEGLYNVDVINRFPKNMKTEMDQSQLRALESMLTKSVAIIQGPPGTGKTFVSVSGLKVMIQNHRPGDPPIIVAAQTNHALDQLLNHIMAFEPKICRLGGRSAREEIEIRKRTLYELRMATNMADLPDGGKGLKFCRNEFVKCGVILKQALQYFLSDKVLTSEILLSHNIITEGQQESLVEDGWDDDEDDEDASDIQKWLGDSQLMPIAKAPPVDQTLPMEDTVDQEEIEDVEAMDDELPAKGKEMDTLLGDWVPFVRQTCGRHSTPVVEKQMKRLLASTKNLYEIPVAQRGKLYRYFELRLMKEIHQELQVAVKKYQEAVNTYFIIKGLCNIRLLNHHDVKVIGCTTTGLAKYRAFLSALGPRTLLIEEAAETLEGKIIGGLFESLQQLILVGDHKQLQASCNIKTLEEEPYYMGISMFERLVKNKIEYIMLNTQRRMIPEIRQLLCIQDTLTQPDGAHPFYKNLYDHHSVLNRAKIPGMGHRNLYFFDHKWPEMANAELSRYNPDEAEMVVGFFNYLVLNGVHQDQITILTFYNGQRKTLITELKKRPGLKALDKPFKVYTVDSYQGEENDIVLLSLVRSNNDYGIGFLENQNRLVVALSRARRGLYLFGNSLCLSVQETSENHIGRKRLWFPLIDYMGRHGQYKYAGGLPITCQKHHNENRVYLAEQWDIRAGGCDLKCEEGNLPCGHPCIYRCHPFEHSRVRCHIACSRTLTCGHGCSRFCGETCYCDACLLYDGGQFHSQTSEVTDSIPKNQMVIRKAPLASEPIGCKYFKSGSELSPERSGRRNPPTTVTRQPRTFLTQQSKPFEGPLPYNSGDWKKWDAKKADEDIAERRKKEQENHPQINSRLQFTETYRPVKIVDGTRVMEKPQNKHKIVRHDDELGDSSPERPPCRYVATIPATSTHQIPSQHPSTVVRSNELATMKEHLRNGTLQATTPDLLGFEEPVQRLRLDNRVNTLIEDEYPADDEKVSPSASSRVSRSLASLASLERNGDRNASSMRKTAAALENAALSSLHVPGARRKISWPQAAAPNNSTTDPQVLTTPCLVPSTTPQATNAQVWTVAPPISTMVTKVSTTTPHSSRYEELMGLDMTPQVLSPVMSTQPAISTFSSPQNSNFGDLFCLEFSTPVNYANINSHGIIPNTRAFETTPVLDEDGFPAAVQPDVVPTRSYQRVTLDSDSLI